VAKNAKTASASKTGTITEVDEFMKHLEHPLKGEIEATRAIILSADARIRESVKWNAPSFYITDHFATFKLQPPKAIQIVFHTGAKVKPDAAPIKIDDPSGLLKWVTKDRCLATFNDMDDVRAKREALAAIVRQWTQALSA
jgi:hypothetical protein